MRYWDTSALLPMLIREASTDQVKAWMTGDDSILTWWATEIECVSALSRLEREDPAQKPVIREAHHRLKLWRNSWNLVQPTGAVRESAIRLLRVHPLRTADALQLAAACVASQNRRDTLEFVSLDHRLTAAAEKEGFPVLTAKPAD